MADQEQPPLQRGTSALVVAQTIRNQIEAGELRHGEQLPTTRTLAERWDTSVATITRAMNLLASQGLIVNRARSSRLVNYPPTATGRRSRPTPQVILIGGYAGSGKTELGRIIARRTGWAMLDKDSTTRTVVEAALESLGISPHDRESNTYLEVIRPAEYQALLATTRENVECGTSVVVTAPFIRELSDKAWCDRTAAMLHSLGAALHVVWVRCDAPSMNTYLRQRGAARDAYKLAHWDEYLAGIDLAFEPAITHHVIDNSVGASPLQQQAAELLTKNGVRL